MGRPGKATVQAARNFWMSLSMSLSRTNRARRFAVASCLYAGSSHHVLLPNPSSIRGLLSPLMKTQGRACPQGCRTRRGEISAKSLFPSSHTCLHVRNLVLARAHVGENRLPLEAANVLGVRVVVSVEVGHHFLKFGWIMLAELAEDEEAAQVQRIAGLVVGLIPPGDETDHREPFGPHGYGVGEAEIVNPGAHQRRRAAKSACVIILPMTSWTAGISA